MIIQAERGQHPHGGDGYGYAIGDRLGAIDALFTGSDVTPIGDFIFEDPEQILENIEMFESMGRDVAEERARYEAAAKRPAWYDPALALESLAFVEASIDKLGLGPKELEELSYDLRCYSESLRFLADRGVGFRLL